jgi:hypothetical protein
LSAAAAAALVSAAASHYTSSLSLVEEEEEEECSGMHQAGGYSRPTAEGAEEGTEAAAPV